MPLTARSPPALSVPPPVEVRVAVRAFLSVMLTLAPVTVTLPTKSLPVLFRVTSLPSAVIPVVPPTVSGPVWLTVPVLVVERLPLSVVGPKLVPPPLVVVVVRSLAVPLTARSPPALSVPPPVEARVAVRAFLSVMLTVPPFTVTSPTKSLPGLDRVTLLLPALMFEVPVTVSTLVWVTGPVEVAVRSPVTVVGPMPKVKPAESVVRLPVVPSTVRAPTAVSSVTPVVTWAVRSFLSLMDVAPPARVSSPTKSLPGLDNVTLLLPALRFDVPFTVRVFV